MMPFSFLYILSIDLFMVLHFSVQLYLIIHVFLICCKNFSGLRSMSIASYRAVTQQYIQKTFYNSLSFLKQTVFNLLYSNVQQCCLSFFSFQLLDHYQNCKQLMYAEKLYRYYFYLCNQKGSFSFAIENYKMVISPPKKD